MAKSKKLDTWEEIKKKFPSQWVAIRDVKFDKNSYLSAGTVFCNEKNKSLFINKAKQLRQELGIEKELTAQRFTGEFKPLRTWEIDENEAIL